MILLCGNIDLIQLSPKKLKTHFICEKHFPPTHFLARKLVKSAVPVPYLRTTATETNTKFKTYTSSNVDVQISSTSKQGMVYVTTPKKRKIALSDVEEDEIPLADISNLPSPNTLDTLRVNDH
ncbi:hypothetical protein FQR65_LT17471 [Abscondita terminalis]|nr:hypothetical protein FQR65_LT17471 [Abscondita terminalis]